MIRIGKGWIFMLLAFAMAVLAIGFNIRFFQNDAGPVASSAIELPIAKSENTSAPSLGLPIDCQLGKDCYIMHYVDQDPSSAILDFGCGRQTYDGHDGTDFGIADLEKMAAGVPVIAVADGTVLRTRDGVADRLIANQADKTAIQGKECGNGVVIDHGNGWSTQYCHLRKNSVVAKSKTPIKKGTVLGMVGSSGLASFPHVHLTVRYQEKAVDPFVGINSGNGCAIAKAPLWANPTPYVPTGLLSAGFAPKAPTQLEIWQGKYNATSLPATSSALVFWIHSYGILAGDVEQIKLIDPQGKVVVDRQKTLNTPSRSFLSYGGQRQISPGKWQGNYQLTRNGKVVVAVDRSVLIGS
jgi:murein DD-endopeptidase